MDGALLIHKHEGVSSFGIIEMLQRRLIEQRGVRKKELPKLGHGGTLDPFATGLLIVLVGRGVKLARYFLGSTKTYQGRMRFGETTIPGDVTSPISETSDFIPHSIEMLRERTLRFTQEDYLQTPPMHSAKKKNGKPLYELARAGLEVEREAKLCQLYDFSVLEFEAPHAQFELRCSAGTYVRTLTQDYAKHMGTVALLEKLHRTSSGSFYVEKALSAQEIINSQIPWNELPCWMPFDQLLVGYSRAEATPSERTDLLHGKQGVLFDIIKTIQLPLQRSSEKDDCVAIYCEDLLTAVARKENNLWGIERVFT